MNSELKIELKIWTTISEHKNDESLRHGFPHTSATFHIRSIPICYYRYFRIIQNGPNSSGNNFLMLRAFEVYGFVKDMSI